jgi:hypothetical protein
MIEPVPPTTPATPQNISAMPASGTTSYFFSTTIVLTEAVTPSAISTTTT